MAHACSQHTHARSRRRKLQPAAHADVTRAGWDRRSSKHMCWPTQSCASSTQVLPAACAATSPACHPAFPLPAPHSQVVVGDEAGTVGVGCASAGEASVWPAWLGRDARMRHAARPLQPAPAHAAMHGCPSAFSARRAGLPALIHPHPPPPPTLISHRARLPFCPPRAAPPQVIQAVRKAVEDAKRNLVSVPLNKNASFPHRIDGYFGAAKVRAPAPAPHPHSARTRLHPHPPPCVPAA